MVAKRTGTAFVSRKADCLHSRTLQCRGTSSQVVQWAVVTGTALTTDRTNTSLRLSQVPPKFLTQFAVLESEADQNEGRMATRQFVPSGAL